MEQISMVEVDRLHAHGHNPRIDAAQVTGLIESIRVHGIEVPLVAAPSSHGEGYVVLGGHRRLTAALALALPEVPVQIRPDLQAPSDQLAFMATENLHRDQLTAIEEARLVQDMLDLGMTHAQVSEQTALGKKRVSERVKLGKLAESTGDKVHRGQITVEEAMIIAEYADDPDAVEQLEQAAGTYNFDFYASRAKATREARKAAAAARKQAKKDGLRLTTNPDYTTLDLLVRTGRFATDHLKEIAGGTISDDDWTAALADAHKDCPGHAGYLVEHGYYAGRIQLCCDAADEQHPTNGPTTNADAERAPDPWDDISADDFLAARHHREAHLAQALPKADMATEATIIAADGIIKQAWREYGDDESAITLLQGITGAEGKTKVHRALTAWPLPVLTVLREHFWDINRDHRYMAEGRQGSSYWGTKGTLRQLLDATDYHWSLPEQTAILLATGTAHDATQAEAGEQA